jgi:hypothetical protein
VSVVILNLRLGHKETHELKLVRNVWPVVHLATTVTHIIDEDSPLFTVSTDDLLSGRYFFVVLFSGLDPIVGENMFSRKTYHSCDLLVGHHFVDNMKLAADGIHIDLEAINDTTFVPDSDLHDTHLSPGGTALSRAPPPGSTSDLDAFPSPSSTTRPAPWKRRSRHAIEREDGAETSPRAAQYALV